MGATTGITWTNATWNPIRGCSRVSPGCMRCYAEVVAGRFAGPGQPYEGLTDYVGGKPRWNGTIMVVDKHREDPLGWRTPKRIFVNSMSDLFHERLDAHDIATIYAVAVAAVHLRGHQFQVLTKRPGRARDLLRAADFWDEVNELATLYVLERAGTGADPLEEFGPAHPPPGIWLGTSVEDQPRAEERIPQLLATPAAVRWISAEPLLGPIDLAPWLRSVGMPGGCLSIDGDWWHTPGSCPSCLPALDWVVVGGESGSDHRPMELAWLTEIVDACWREAVPVFTKQDAGSRPGRQGRIPDHYWLRQYPAAAVPGGR